MSEHTPKIILQAAKEAGLISRQITPDVNAYHISSNNTGKTFIAAEWIMYPNQQQWQAGLMKYKELSTKFLDNGDFVTIPGKFFYTESYTPQNLLISLQDYVDQGIGFPCVIKPNNGSQSRNIYIIDSPEELSNKIEEIHQNIPELLIQKYIDSKEYRVFIYKGSVKFLYKKSFVPNTPGTDRLQESPQEKESMMISEFPTYLKDFAQKLFEYTQTEVVGVDIFLDYDVSAKQKITIIELNHNPGLAVMYHTYSEKDFVINLLSGIYKDYVVS